MGSTWWPNMDQCLRLTTDRARFEIRDTPFDHSRTDPPGKLRSEISGSLPGDRSRLPNNVALWGAMSFIHHPWADPAGMAKLLGGVHGQIHIGRTFGGSPAVAFRRTGTGAFAITTRGQHAPHNALRYTGPVSFGQVHDLVYRVILHPSEGALAVWLHGEPIVDIVGVSIGTEHAESYWNLGCYYAGRTTCPVVAEYANHIYPGAVDLRSRIAHPPGWPLS